MAELIDAPEPYEGRGRRRAVPVVLGVLLLLPLLALITLRIARPDIFSGHANICATYERRYGEDRPCELRFSGKDERTMLDWAVDGPLEGIRRGGEDIDCRFPARLWSTREYEMVRARVNPGCEEPSPESEPIPIEQEPSGVSEQPDPEPSPVPIPFETGIPACDTLLRRMLCAADKSGPEVVKTTLEATKDWEGMGNDPETAESARDNCARALEAGKAGWQGIGCE